MTKDALRKYYMGQRQALTESQCAQFNLQLYHLFFSTIDLSFLKVVHCYLPLPGKNEPDTWMIIDRVRREFPHIRISLPKVEGQDLHHYYYEGLHQIKTGPWGLQEPGAGSPTPIDKIDLVLVPLLSFDSLGHRVGYGKGYYDRFLSQCKQDCQKIGLSFFEGISKIDDVHVGDTQLTACITPTGIVSF